MYAQYQYLSVVAVADPFLHPREARIPQWLECRTRDWKVAGSSPGRRGGRNFLSSFLCWLLFRYPFHPRVTTIACKRSRSFCPKVQGGGLQLNTHAPTLCGFAWSDVTWCMVVWCTENAPRRQQYGSRDTSHVTPNQTALHARTLLRWIFKNARYKKASHTFRITCERSECARERSFGIALFMSASVPQAYRFLTFKRYWQNRLKLLL